MEQMPSISDQQLSLLNELFIREGLPAVKQYLLQHRGFDKETADRIIRICGFLDNTCKDCAPMQQSNPVEFQHYCIFDSSLWVGPEGSLCPQCGTDGLHEKEPAATTWFGKIKAFFV